MHFVNLEQKYEDWTDSDADVICRGFNTDTKFLTHDAVPRRIVFLVEFFRDIGRSGIIIHAHYPRGAIYGVMLHFIGHVRIGHFWTHSSTGRLNQSHILKTN